MNLDGSFHLGREPLDELGWEAVVCMFDIRMINGPYAREGTLYF